MPRDSRPLGTVARVVAIIIVIAIVGQLVASVCLLAAE